MIYKCEIGIDGSGVDEAITIINEFRREMDGKVQEHVERLAMRGVEVARMGFANAVYDGAGGLDSPPGFVWTGPTSGVVRVNGPTCLFIEFGTGVVYPDNHPEAAKNGMIRGEYGKGYGKQKTWGYYGTDLGSNGKFATYKNGRPKEPPVVLTHGNPANAPMYNAVKALEDEITKIAREVFSN